MTYYRNPSTGGKYYLNQPFTHGGIKYTRAAATVAKFNELGFSRIVPQLGKDPFFYNNTPPNEFGEVVSTPKDLAEVKAKLIEREKSRARETLRKTDWLIIRFLENTTAIPADVTTFREALRTIVDSRCAAINATATIEDLENLYNAPSEIEDPSNPGTMIANTVALDAYPEEVTGYTY